MKPNTLKDTIFNIVMNDNYLSMEDITDYEYCIKEYAAGEYHEFTFYLVDGTTRKMIL